MRLCILMCMVLLATISPYMAVSQPSITIPTRGTVIAEYRSAAGLTPLLFGIDLQTNAMFMVSRENASIFEILLKMTNGQFAYGTAGASQMITSETSTLDEVSLIRPFPFLLRYYLHLLPNEAYRIDANDDGTTLYACTLRSGSVGTTLRDLPDGFITKDQRIDYIFSPDGRLLTINNHTLARTESLEYVECDTPALAIPKSFSNGAWVLHDYEIHPKGRPDLFTPEAVTARARDMLVAFNERQNEMSQTPEPNRQLAKSIEQLGGESSPLRTKRYALILTGLIVIAVGSLAWWKHRG